MTGADSLSKQQFYPGFNFRGAVPVRSMPGYGMLGMFAGPFGYWGTPGYSVYADQSGTSDCGSMAGLGTYSEPGTGVQGESSN